MKEKTKVGRYVVPVRNAQFASIVSFTAGEHGRKERGHYCFWVAVLRGTRRVIIGRARLLREPGYRFTLIGQEARTAKTAADRKAYARHWRSMGAGKSVRYIRPATLREIHRWAVTHESDWQHVVGITLA